MNRKSDLESLKKVEFAMVFIIFILNVTNGYSSINLSLNILIRYYDYKLFLGFSIVVYAINLLIYKFSLKRILDRPTIDLIRTE